MRITRKSFLWGLSVGSALCAFGAAEDPFAVGEHGLWRIELADVGVAFVAYSRETKDVRFLNAAVRIAETYLKMRRPDGSWPLKMKLATGEPIGDNTLVPNYPMSLFNALSGATGEAKWAQASDACFAWLETNPLADWNWDGQFEDIKPEKPYANPTKHNAIDTVFEILRRFPDDPKRIEQCRAIVAFCEKRFVCWERPESHPNWTDMPAVLEQYSCFVPIDASAAKMIRGYLALWRVTKDPVLLAKARALGDTLTRVQAAERTHSDVLDARPIRRTDLRLAELLRCVRPGAAGAGGNVRTRIGLSAVSVGVWYNG